MVQGKHESYKLSAASQVERDSWIDAIRWARVLVRLTATANVDANMEWKRFISIDHKGEFLLFRCSKLHLERLFISQRPLVVNRSAAR